MNSGPRPEVEHLAREILHRGRVFDLVRLSLLLPSGIRQDIDLVEHPGAVAIAARDERGRMLAVRQYRAAANAWTVEIPAGRIDAGEDPLAAARRELEEETGFRARHWRLLRTFLPAAGFASEVMHLFLAEGLSEVPGGGLTCDQDEELAVLWRTPEELLGVEPGDAKTLIAALLIGGDRA